MRFRTLTAVAAIAVVAALPYRACADVVDFDTPAEYETKFRDNSNGPIFTWAGGGGVGWRPGFIVVADEPRLLSTALYREPFDLSAGVRHEVSAYFYTSLTNRQGVVGRVGWAPGADANFSAGHPWVGATLHNGSGGDPGVDYRDQYRLVASHVAGGAVVDEADGATPADGTFGLFSGHWYKLSAGWTYAGGGTFDYDATLTDHGRTGDDFVPDVVRSIRGSLTNPAFSDPAGVRSMFAGVRADAPVTRAWDEFEARAVPEPAAAAAFMVAAAAGLMMRRPRRA